MPVVAEVKERQCVCDLAQQTMSVLFTSRKVTTLFLHHTDLYSTGPDSVRDRLDVKYLRHPTTFA